MVMYFSYKQCKSHKYLYLIGQRRKRQAWGSPFITGLWFICLCSHFPHGLSLVAVLCVDFYLFKLFFTLVYILIGCFSFFIEWQVTCSKNINIVLKNTVFSYMCLLLTKMKALFMSSVHLLCLLLYTAVNNLSWHMVDMFNHICQVNK